VLNVPTNLPDAGARPLIRALYVSSDRLVRLFLVRDALFDLPEAPCRHPTDRDPADLLPSANSGASCGAVGDPELRALIFNPTHD